MNVVEAEELVVTYRRGKVIAVNGISFSVKEGEVFVLIGPDGAGKSSILKAICGVKSYREGNLRVFGEDPNKEREFEKIKEKISFMPQGLGQNLYHKLSVEENIDFFAELYGVPLEEKEKRKEELLKITGLYSFKRRKAGKLSGGMMQKLGICCSLIHKPKLLVLDEPTTGVDPLSRREIWKLIYRFSRGGTTVIVSTSYLDEAERGTGILFMEKGKELFKGTPEELTKVDLEVFVVEGKDIEEAYHRAWTISKTPRFKGNKLRVVSSEGKLREILKDLNVSIKKVKPNLEDVFVEKIGLVRVEVPEEFKPKVEVPDIAISVEGVTKKFGKFTAVDNVSFTVRRGEIFAFLGPNGAGKTTLIKTIIGLYSPTEGKIRVADRENNFKNLIGYMSQKFSLYSDLTVIENLILWGSVYGVKPSKVKEIFDSVSSSLGLRKFEREIVKNLPLGIKQRVALLSALIHSPAILFLDEPTSGVDPVERDALWQLIRGVSRKFGTTVIVTTHYMNEAEYCDRILMMNRGKIIALGTPDELKKEVAMSQAKSEITMEDVFVFKVEESEGKEN